MADAPDQRQLNTHKWIRFAFELKKTCPINRQKNIGVTCQKHTPHYAKKSYYAFLARFGVCLGGTGSVGTGRRLGTRYCPLPKRYNCIDARKHTQNIP